jgi:hypothetical protein
MTPFSKWKTIGYAAAIFIAGGVSGGALGFYQARSSLSTPPREQEMALRMRMRLKTRLGLSSDQEAKIEPIIETAVSELHSIRADTAQQMNKVFETSFAQVSALLTPDQRVKLEQIQNERRAMLARWQGGHHRPGHGDSDGPGQAGPPPASSPSPP